MDPTRPHQRRHSRHRPCRLPAAAAIRRRAQADHTPLGNDPHTGKDFDAISKDGPLPSYGGGFLTVRAVKLLADGALGSRGAAMLAPNSDDPGNRSLLLHQPDELTAMIGKGLAKGYQACIHAIGDRANREVLDSFEAA